MCVFVKAIIMAGGEGTRLRPLTCDCPKPMIKLMNRPVMQYALALLKRHGITQAAATLGYLPDAIMDVFGAGDDFGVDLRYTLEKTPLGTAGGVRQAADFLDETFVVLSGDGITDLDLTDAIAFHRSRDALATLVLKHADNPMDYGVVCADGEGRVRSFHEKPGWSDVVSDTVNTGIYILEPEVLRRVPEGRPCDFGHDLFPALVKEGLPVFGYVMQGYWCDIGDIRAYLAAHADALEGRIRLEGLVPEARVTLMPGAAVDRSAVLEGPCLIGPDARVLAGAYVGPGSVLGSGCVVGEGASVKRSVLWPGARLEAGAQARGCVLATGAALGPGAQAYEESVLGTGSVAGERTVLLPGVKLWPEKRAADGERLDANLVWGRRREPGFVAGALEIDSPSQAARAAQAVVSVLKPRELLLGRGEGGRAGALWHAAAAGAMAQGARVVDAGLCLLPQLRAAQRALGCDCAALVLPDSLLPLNRLGARLPNGQQRAITAHNIRQDYAAPFSGATPSTADPGPTDAAYVAGAAACFAADPARAPRVLLRSKGALALSLAERAFLRAGLAVRLDDAASGDEAMPGADSGEKAAAAGQNEVAVELSEDGQRFALADASGPLSEGEVQLLLAWTALESGERALLLPVQATRAIQVLAGQYGARAEYLSGEPALWMNALAERHPLQWLLQSDGISAALAALSALTAAGLSLSEWRQRMPAVSRSSRSVPVAAAQTGRVLHALAQREARVELGGGMRLCRDGGWAWICPDERRSELRIVAEAASAEFAGELCDFCERELKRLASAAKG